MPNRPARTIAILAVGTLAVSTAAPLIKLAQMPAVAVAGWRCLLCGLIYAAVRPKELHALRTMGRRDAARLALGSVLLAAHFALWISAFDHTSYASAVLLLVMQPVFGALLGMLCLGERHGARTWIALAGSAGGLALLVRGDLDQPGGLFGDGLAVAACLTIAFFYLAVRPLRTRYPFAPFMASCYGLAGLLLCAVSIAIGSPLIGFPDASWGYLAGLVLIPTVVGHACFNWAIPRVRFFTINLLIVLEPAIAILLGVAFLDERATPLQLGGGALLGLAVVAGLGGRRPEKEREEAEQPLSEQPRSEETRSEAHRPKKHRPAENQVRE